MLNNILYGRQIAAIYIVTAGELKTGPLALHPEFKILFTTILITLWKISTLLVNYNIHIYGVYYNFTGCFTGGHSLGEHNISCYVLGDEKRQ